MSRLNRNGHKLMVQRKCLQPSSTTTAQARKNAQMPHRQTSRKISLSVKGRWADSHLNQFMERLPSFLSSGAARYKEKTLWATANLQSMALEGTVSPYDYAILYQLQSLKKKHFDPDDKSGEEDRRDAALTTFYSGEAACRASNSDELTLLRSFLPEESYLCGISEQVRLEIEKIIGSKPPDLDVLFDNARPGPGSTLFKLPNHLLGAVTSFYKTTEPTHLTVTKEAYQYALLFISRDERWMRALEEAYRNGQRSPYAQKAQLKTGPLPRMWLSHMITVVPSVDKIGFAKKNAVTHRTIGIGPGLNIMLQLGVDGVFRKQLISNGINLNSQRHNQNLARDGIERDLVTIDVKNASGCIAKRVVRDHFPVAWVDYLDKLRCNFAIVNNELHEYEQYSSMGNGFTFTLETILFFAICRAVAHLCGRRLGVNEVAVYGDDIIVPKDLALMTIEALKLFGFDTNLEKTYITGYFRESCGQDYYYNTHKGVSVDVRPVFIKEYPEFVDDLYDIYNRLRAWCKQWLDATEDEVWWLIGGILNCHPTAIPLPWGPSLREPISTHLYTTDVSKYEGKRDYYRFQRVLRKAEEYDTPKTFFFRRVFMAKLRHNFDPLAGTDLYREDHKMWIRMYKDGLIDWDVLVGNQGGQQFRLTRRRKFTVSLCKATYPKWMVDHS